MTIDESDSRQEWTRFWSVHGDHVETDEDGFLLDPSSGYGSYANAGVKLLSDFADFPCLVLLGEPGMGKTTALRTESDRVSRDVDTAAGDEVFWRELDTYDNEDLLVRRVFEHSTIAAWRVGTHRLHLFLDGFDECQLGIPNLGKLLISELRELGVQNLSRLTLRLACRAQDWPAELHRELGALWSVEQSAMVLDLLPLRAADVELAASDLALDTERFLREVRRQAIGALASRPITLKLLLDHWGQHGAFPQRRVDLYEEGARRWCRKWVRDREAAGLSAEFSEADLMAMAARLGAVTVLTGRRHVLTERDETSPPDEILALEDVLDPTERLEARRALRGVALATLGTGLFTGDDRRTRRWAHLTFGEFFAARFLANQEIVIRQLLNILQNPEDPEHGVAEQLHEVAAWAATMRPDLYAVIIRSDPALLLRSDVAATTPEDRASLVDQLLLRWEQEAPSGRYGEDRYYYKLAYPGLADQLRPWLEGDSGDDWARICALDIAYECGLTGLGSMIADLALDDSLSNDVRRHAARMVSKIGDSPAREKLLPLLGLSSEDDPDERLKGLALWALWPDLVGVDQVVAVIGPPRHDRVIGSYDTFLVDGLVGRSRVDQLPTLLQWAASWDADRPPNLTLQKLEIAMMRRAWTACLDAQDVMLAFAGLVVAQFERSDHDSDLNDLAGEVALDVERRRSVLQALLPLLSDVGWGVAPAIAGWPRWAVSDDISWLLAQFAAADTDDARRVLAALIRHLLDAQRMDDVEAVYEATLESPILERALRPLFGAVLLDDPSTIRLREMLDRRAASASRAEERRAALPPSQISELLSEPACLIPQSWARLCYELRIDRARAMLASPDSNLREAPGWSQVSPLQYERLLQLGLIFVREESPTVNAPDIGSELTLWSFAGYQALRLLHENARFLLDTLPDDVWARWSAVIVACPYQGMDADAAAQVALVTRAYAIVPEQVIQAALRAIDAQNSQNGRIFVLHQLSRCFDDRLRTTLREKARDSSLKPDSLRELLTTLIERGGSEEVDLARSLIPAQLPIEADKRERVLAAAHALLSAPDAGWTALWPLVGDNPEFGHRLLGLGTFWSSGDEEELYARLNETQLGDLLVWLDSQSSTGSDAEGILDDTESIEWRSSRLINHLILRGTDAAIETIRRLISALPHRELGLRRVLRAAQEQRRRLTWTPPTAEEILHLAKDKRARVVRSADELLDAVVESLRSFEEELQADLGSVVELWNERSESAGRGGAARVNYAWPKDEVRFTDAAVRHLRRELSPSGIVVNREVEVHRGNETDIHVDMPLHHPGSDNVEIVSLVVEAKGSWHRELWSAMETQLVNRYLGHGDAEHGIYLVGWFRCAAWNDPKDRRTRQRSINRAQAQVRLDLQANALSSDGVQVRAVVVNAGLR